ncbi:MAG TPA: hypothetical protein VNM37_16605 [Candidatus Dormibacteraeota bacterium]|jgi:hypothetical protein|nr:hypothetical protein [Candidatus Dormibacteraeota bacterium]
MATTSTRSRIPPPQLQSLAQRLKAWRSARVPGQRIPEELWKAAAELARVHGLSRTATALHLSYYDLQRRLSGSRAPRRPRVSLTHFVELAPPTVPAAVHEQGTLEVVQSSGARLTLRLPNASPKDLLPMVQLFLRRR